MATTEIVELAEALLLVPDAGCWVIMTCGGICEPLMAKIADVEVPPTAGLLKVMDAIG